MNQWDNALKALAPGPSTPGRGTGNQPFAPGMMNGDYATPGSSSQLFSRLGQLQGQQGIRQSMQQATGAYSGTPGSDQPPQAGPPMSMQWTPEVQQEVMNYLMNVLRSTSPGWKMTTTGGVDPGQGYGAVR